MRKNSRTNVRGRPQRTRYLAAGEVPVFAQLAVQGFEEHRVGDLADVHAGVIQDGDDPLVLLLHQVHDDLIVEVVDLPDTARKQCPREQGPDPETPVPRVHLSRQAPSTENK